MVMFKKQSEGKLLATEDVEYSRSAFSRLLDSVQVACQSYREEYFDVSFKNQGQRQLKPKQNSKAGRIGAWRVESFESQCKNAKTLQQLIDIVKRLVVNGSVRGVIGSSSSRPNSLRYMVQDQIIQDLNPWNEKAEWQLGLNAPFEANKGNLEFFDKGKNMAATREAAKLLNVEVLVDRQKTVENLKQGRTPR